jgi:GNAT superfamily N-acetyltransferase
MAHARQLTPARDPDRSADAGPVGRSGNRVWRRARRLRPVLVHVLAHAAARIRGVDRGQDTAAVPARVEAGPPPGLLAYRDGAPIGWVQVGPRADVPGWNGARRLTAPTAEAPADDPRVWGISCFVTRAGCRRQGIATALLMSAVDWARKNGARVLDACPVDGSANRPPISLYHGLASTFRRACFRKVARRRPRSASDAPQAQRLGRGLQPDP